MGHSGIERKRKGKSIHSAEVRFAPGEQGPGWGSSSPALAPENGARTGHGGFLVPMACGSWEM